MTTGAFSQNIAKVTIDRENFVVKTRTMHAHDAPRHSVPVRIAHAGRPCGVEMSEISQSSRTITVESSMKSEHNLYLACEDSPQHAFYF